MAPSTAKTHTNIAPATRPAARVCDEMRCAAWLQQQGQKQQPDATVAETSDTQTVLSHHKNTMPANILESSEVIEAEKISTDMEISDNTLLGLNTKSRIRDTLNSLLYAGSSTDVKWLKRKVTFKMSSFNLDFEH